MKTIFSAVGAGFNYFCVATVIAIAAALTAMWVKGALDQGRMYRVLAALHGIDVITMQRQLIEQEKETDSEQPSHTDRLERQTLKNLDLDLREAAVSNGLMEMKAIQAKLEVETSRFDELKKAYTAKLQEFADEEQATSLKELQRTLEAIKPVQAKEQILKMIEDDAIDDVVSILTSMSIDKRKKVIGEFKQPNDAEVLYEILKHIRKGEPLASQIRETQEKLKEFGNSR